MPPDDYPLLGTLAVQAGVLTEAELEDVLLKAAERGVALGEMLFKLGYVSRDRLLELVAEQYDTTVYDLREWRPEPQLLSALPPEFVREYQMLPVSIEGGRIVVAAAGPFTTPLPDLLDHVRDLTSCRAEVVLCEAEALRRYIAEFYAGEAAPAPAPAPSAAAPQPDSGATAAAGGSLSDFSSLVSEIRAEADEPPPTEATARAELDEVLDRAFALLIETRAHEFLNPVLANTNSAAELLDKAKQYQHMGMFAEGLTLAHRADRQLSTALRRAHELQQAWGPLLQHVELLRTRLTQLDAEQAADFAPQEMGRLREIREATNECVETKAIDQLRALVDEGQLLIERIGALSPRHNRRERLIESLTHVREVLARARKLGAQTVASKAVEAAYRLLDDADARARENAWDAVEDALAQALAHAKAAEARAVEYAEQRKEARSGLHNLCDTVDTAMQELANHPAVQAIVPGLLAASRRLTAARVAADGDTDTAPHHQALVDLRDTELPALRQSADDAHAHWADLGWTIEAAATAARDGIRTGLSGHAATAAGQVADDILAFFRALNDRNLSTAQAVVQEAEQRLRDFWEMAEQFRGEHQRIDARFRDTTGALAAAVARVNDPDMQDTLEKLQADLTRAGNALAGEEFGDAEALLDSIDHAITNRLPASASDLGPVRSEAQAQAWGLARTLADLAAAEAATLAPTAYPTFVEAVERAMQTAREEDVAAAEAAIAEATKAERAVRADLDAALTTRAEALTRRLGEVEARLRETVEAAAAQGAPELLEEGFYEVNSARSLLEEHAAAIPLGPAARIESHLRAVEIIIQQVGASGGHDRRRLEAALEQLKSELTALDGDLEGLLAQPDLGLDHPALQDATDSLAEAHSVHAQGDLARGYELLRHAERIMDDLRHDRTHAGDQREDLAQFFSSVLPDHLAALDGTLLAFLAPEPWEELQATVQAADEAQGLNDVSTLARLHGRVVDLIEECSAAERTERTQRLVDTQRAQAAAEAAVRLATLLQAETRSPDLFAAATQLKAAGDNAVRVRAWQDAVGHFAAAATRAAQAQEAALSAAQQASEAQGDLLRTAADHLARGDVESAQTTLQAAKGAAERATPPPPDSGGLARATDLDVHEASPPR